MTADEAAIHLRMTGRFDAIADLISDPTLAAQVRNMRVQEGHRDKMIRARVTVILFRRELGETRDDVLTECISLLYYGGNIGRSVADKILRGSLASTADTKAAGDLARSIWESPTLLAAHLKQLEALRERAIASLAARP